MSPGQVLREAARLVERGEERWGCGAIARVLGIYDRWNWGPSGALPADVFEPFALMAQKKSESRDYDVFGFEDADHRVVALCLAAAIADWRK